LQHRRRRGDRDDKSARECGKAHGKWQRHGSGFARHGCRGCEAVAVGTGKAGGQVRLAVVQSYLRMSQPPCLPSADRDWEGRPSWVRRAAGRLAGLAASPVLPAWCGEKSEAECGCMRKHSRRAVGSECDDGLG
jgi:hypothetical protein